MYTFKLNFNSQHQHFKMQSVERPTLIELFSTFFDRLSSNHPQRDTMIKDLYQFKSLLYTNDNQGITTFLDSLQLKPRQNLEKSPLRDCRMNRESSSQRTGNSQNKVNLISYSKLNSQRKEIQDKENIKKQDQNSRQSDENLDLVKHRLQHQSEIRSLNSKTPTSRLIKNNIMNNNSNVLNVSQLKQENIVEEQLSSTYNLQISGTSRITRMNSKRNIILTSCGHELDKDTFSKYVNSRVKESQYVDCPVCSTQLPLSEYSAFIHINPFDEFKQTNFLLLKALQNIVKNDEAFITIIQAIDSDDFIFGSKQRQISTGSDLIKNLQLKDQANILQINGNSRIVSQESEFNQKLKKCLRCSKTVEGGSYFCQACKNF